MPNDQRTEQITHNSFVSSCFLVGTFILNSEHHLKHCIKMLVQFTLRILMKMPLIKTDRKLSNFLPFLLKVAKFDRFQKTQKLGFYYPLFREWLWLKRSSLWQIQWLMDPQIYSVLLYFHLGFFFNLTFGERIL